MELREIVKAKNDAIAKYSEMQKEKLIDLCKECGIYDADVVAVGKKGRILVEKKSYSSDYEINFYHYTKNGSLSKNATYTGLYISGYGSDEKIKEKINDTFSLAL